MAKSLQQLTEGYTRMVRSQRQNAAKLASGEWDDDDVFLEAVRQACQYAGRAAPSTSSTSSTTAPSARRELLASYTISEGTALLDVNTVDRSLVPFQDTPIPELGARLPERDYDMYGQLADGKLRSIIIDLDWRPFRVQDFRPKDARAWMNRYPVMRDTAERIVDEYPTLAASLQAKATYLREHFSL